MASNNNEVGRVVIICLFKNKLIKKMHIIVFVLILSDLLISRLILYCFIFVQYPKIHAS